MGIQNLSSFIQRYPKAIETININEYAYKIIAVDTSLYMCKFKAVAGDRWLSEFVRLVYTLRANDIHCLFVYDTKSPPEKTQEKQRRRDTREKSENKIEEIIDILDRYNLSNTLEEKEKIILMDFQKQRKITTPVRLLLAQEHKEELNIRALQQEVEKIRKQHFSISPEDFEKTKKLFKILDVHYILAPMEAETTCADLCKRGIVDAVLSEDTDVLAYGCPMFLCKISTNKGVGTCTRINFKVLLEEMELSEQQFLDFCIMCGTDYNHNIPKIGSVTAYRLIKQHGMIEDIEKTGINVSILNHIKTRSLFTDYEKVEWEKQYCGIPNFNRLQKFFVVNNITIRVEEIEKHFTSSIVIEN
jgi:flap endonuclease-1